MHCYRDTPILVPNAHRGPLRRLGQASAQPICSGSLWPEIKVPPASQGAVHERLLLAPGGVDHVVNDEAEHLVHVHAGLGQMPGQRCPGAGEAARRRAR